MFTRYRPSTMILPSRLRRRMTASAPGSWGTSVSAFSCSVISGHWPAAFFSAAAGEVRLARMTTVNAQARRPARNERRSKQRRMNDSSATAGGSLFRFLEGDRRAIPLDDFFKHRADAGELVEIPAAAWCHELTRAPNSPFPLGVADQHVGPDDRTSRGGWRHFGDRHAGRRCHDDGFIFVPTAIDVDRMLAFTTRDRIGLDAGQHAP